MAKSVKLYDRSGQEVWPKVSLSGVYNGGTSMSGISSGKLIKGPDGFVCQSDLPARVGCASGVHFVYHSNSALMSENFPFELYSRINGESFTLECTFSSVAFYNYTIYGLMGLCGVSSLNYPQLGLAFHESDETHVEGIYGVVYDSSISDYKFVGPVLPDYRNHDLSLVHISVNRPTKTVSFYLDGVQVGSTTYGSDFSFPFWFIRLGAYATNASFGINCFRVFGGSISEKDAAERFNSGYLPGLLRPETGKFGATTLIEYIPTTLRKGSFDGLIWANTRGDLDLVSSGAVYEDCALVSDRRTLELSTGLFTTNIRSGVANKDIILPYGYVPMWVVVRSYAQTLSNLSVQIVGTGVYAMANVSVSPDTSVYTMGFCYNADGTLYTQGVAASSDTKVTVRVNASGNAGQINTLSRGMSVTVGCKFIGK